LCREELLPSTWLDVDAPPILEEPDSMYLAPEEEVVERLILCDLACCDEGEAVKISLGFDKTEGDTTDSELL